jgi:tricorn protease
MMRRTGFLVLACVFISAAAAPAADDETLLLRQPTISKTAVAFVYAGDIWIADRKGGEARRLTVNPGVEADPLFSPDGALIAFTGNYDGNTDVYIIPATGGDPRRLTFHPDGDSVRGWTPDGKAVVFRSSRYSNSGRYGQLFTVPVEGGFPQRLPMPMAERGVYSPDATRIAYTPIRDAFGTWKRYRGGQTTPIWLFDVRTYDIEAVPHENASDTFPLWIGDTVYFLSDRNRIMNLFACDTKTKQVKQVTNHADYDVKCATAGDGVIAYEQGGRIHVFNPANGQTTPVKIHVAPDLPNKRPHYVKAGGFIRDAAISPTGKRAAIEARGEIFTVPAKKGDIRNLTQTSGAHERSPAWSPDGKWIAYFSDATGEYRLMIREQTGVEPPRTIPLAEPTFFYLPRWSPDSKKLVFIDKHQNLFWLEVATSKPVRIDTDTYDYLWRSMDPAWSPDSQWIAYAKRLDNHLRAIFVYELATGKTHQVTDGMSDAESPCFSRDGRYLFFAASTNFGLNTGWSDMSSYERPFTRSLYAAVLDKETTSPLAPESDEEPVRAESKKSDEAKKDEPGKDEKKDDKKDEPKKVKIDFENLDQRIVALPLPERNYGDLQAIDGRLFYLIKGERTHLEAGGSPQHELRYFDLKAREDKPFLAKVLAYWISADGKKMLYCTEGNFFAIVDTGSEPKAGDGKIDVDGMEAYCNPEAEWEQMFSEAWRIQRDFFYDPTMHGADWPAIREKYRPFLAYVGHRSDLNAVFGEMFGELVVGHAYVGGGDMASGPNVPGGLLGADYEIVNGFYRIARIYRGENWNPRLRAPLTQPGVNISEGDYVLAVNGRPLKAPTNIYSLFEKTSGKQTRLLVNDKPTTQGARTATVTPIPSEASLRHRAWIEANRRKVGEMTGGRVAYVYMPNTAWDGYVSFNRYYFAQLDRDAVIIDERFNGGGSLADYIIDMLGRPIYCYWASRDGKPFRTPNAVIDGPKAMIINEYAGSGGDAMPYMFRTRGLGQLVGKRTWGGLIGIYDYPDLMDGGSVTAPRMAIFSTDGKWVVENEGITPDFEVEMTPKLVIQGRDPQLEKAVEVVLEQLKQKPPKRPERPPYPERAKK